MKNDNPFVTQEGKAWLKSILSRESVTVLFEKLDGTTREMHCTLLHERIPDESKPKNSGKAQNDEVLAVFDLQKQAWRSFRYDSVKEIRFLA